MRSSVLKDGYCPELKLVINKGQAKLKVIYVMILLIIIIVNIVVLHMVFAQRDNSLPYSIKDNNVFSIQECVVDK